MAFAWTDERIETLRTRLAGGASMRELAAELGCTRNAAIGKAHRLGLVSSYKPPLSQTPSAVRHRGETRTDRPVTLAKTSSPRVTSIGNPFRKPPRPERITTLARAVSEQHAPALRLLASTPAAPVPPRDASHAVDFMGLTPKSCRNPLGPKMARAEMFCGAPVKQGSVYCPTCHGINYAPRQPPTRGSVDKKVSRFGFLAAAE